MHLATNGRSTTAALRFDARIAVVNEMAMLAEEQLAAKAEQEQLDREDEKYWNTYDEGYNDDLDCRLDVHDDYDRDEGDHYYNSIDQGDTCDLDLLQFDDDWY